MSLKIAVLAVGDELLNGEMSDTNTMRIARCLGAHGLSLRESRAVADVEVDIVEALLDLARRQDLVIVTGGLGPTADDLTARAAARAFERRLILSDEALQQIREHFRRSGRPMHAGDEKQALLPQKATILPNPVGSAPGFLLRQGDKDILFLPGVPTEMAAILEQSILARLLERAGGAFPRQERVLKVFGLSEPKTEERLAGSLPAGVTLAFGVDFPFVHVKLRAAGEEAETLLDRAELAARQALDNNVVAIGTGSLVQTVARQMTTAGLTLSLAESCTGGLIAKLLTDLPGASAFLERGAVTYANSAKGDWLGIPADLIAREGAVSEACALAMARGIRRAAGTDVALAVTGIAGPSGGTPGKPVGTVYLALAAADAEQVRGYRFGGEREQIRTLSACMALDWLRRYLGARAAGTPPHPVPEY
ncbi:MAG TPA: CinA family nicotinamide mononucleotide deamidase-related protein [Desulfuromonadales bacterium]|nr:CinA family nicotinamide mononucleotide deamidase-related protein [Desulfuromonadales bacterium]